MMSYRTILYLLCIIALIFSGGGVVSAEEIFEIDDTGAFGETQEPLFSTIFALDDPASMEELLKTCQTDVELTPEEFMLAETVFANAITDEAEIQTFEVPSDVGEELPIAPTSLEAEEVPMLMRQLAVEDQGSVSLWQNVDDQDETLTAAALAADPAAAASTIIQGSSAIMDGFSNIHSSIQFSSSLFSPSSSVFYSYFFSDPYRTYPQVITSTYLTLTASPTNPRPGEYLTLSGKLQDQYGRAIAGAQVRIVRTDERGLVTTIGTARTDLSGNYLFKTIATPGVYWYRSEYRQMPGLVTLGQSNSVRVTCASYQNWEITLTATPTTGYIGDRILLYGFVLSDGYPVGSGTPVELQYQYGGKWYRIVQRSTDAQGVFAYPLQAVAQGTVIVRAVFSDPYGVQKISNSVVLNIIGNPTPVPFPTVPIPPVPGNTGLTLYAQSQNLQSYGSTTAYGWLTSSSGTPLAGMPIVIESMMQQGNSGYMRSTEYRTTNADGSYDITVTASQGSGTITVQAFFQGSGQHPAAESRPVTITFGARQPTSIPTPVPTSPPVTKQVQITAQYSPANPQVGEDVTVSGTLTTTTGQPVSGVLISGVATIQAGTCQATSRNTVNTDASGNYRYVFQPSCNGEAHITIGFDGTKDYRPVSVAFRIPIGRYGPIPMDPIVMMSAP